jgi:hypothetical protein
LAFAMSSHRSGYLLRCSKPSRTSSSVMWSVSSVATAPGSTIVMRMSSSNNS